MSITQAGHGTENDRSNAVNAEIDNAIERQSIETSLLIYDFYNHWKQKNTIEI